MHGPEARRHQTPTICGLLPDKPLIRVFISMNPVDNAPCLAGISQGGQGLIHMNIGRADSGQHGGLRVPAQALLQQTN